MPTRRIIKRRPRDEQPWIFNMPVVQFSNPADKFLIVDQERSPRPKPPPPSAPPPPCITRPYERPRAVPTISGVLASKGSKKAKSNRRKEGNISSALVSELKKKLEQKMIESNQAALPPLHLSSDFRLFFGFSSESLHRFSSLAACRLSKVPCLSVHCRFSLCSLRFLHSLTQRSTQLNLASVVQAYMPAGTASTMAHTITIMWMSFARCSSSLMSLPVTNTMHWPSVGG
ncbi:hypothetical protein EYF80_005942 [Liparis tanakae]|uniref:Uncharacterized protein n=1 Tax=Liparis tanakae TaxID=230148 RepID=A0A4Z2J0T0_9TELE|nr:hypothetical protein EYF80_005942 [Liparis tanakae]